MASITLLTLVQEEFGVELDFERFEELASYSKLRAWLEAAR
jgi:acyl carrier protein